VGSVVADVAEFVVDEEGTVVVEAVFDGAVEFGALVTTVVVVEGTVVVLGTVTRGATPISKTTSFVPSAQLVVVAAVARTVQYPLPTNVNTAVVAWAEQPEPPASTTEYVIAPSPFVVAFADGVLGELSAVYATVGAHDTVWATNTTGPFV
jgi:hypothetical protein